MRPLQRRPGAKLPSITGSSAGLTPRFASQTEAPVDLRANLDTGAHRFGGTPNLNMGAPSVEISEKSVGGAPASRFRGAKSAGAGGPGAGATLRGRFGRGTESPSEGS